MDGLRKWTPETGTPCPYVGFRKFGVRGALRKSVNVSDRASAIVSYIFESFPRFRERRLVSTFRTKAFRKLTYMGHAQIVGGAASVQRAYSGDMLCGRGRLVVPILTSWRIQPNLMIRELMVRKPVLDLPEMFLRIRNPPVLGRQQACGSNHKKSPPVLGRRSMFLKSRHV